jgi:glycosyltransferase involved in cell wall biosynthesis
MNASLIVSTYNWPEALDLALAAIARQSRLPDEVIVADDGSTAATRTLIERVATRFPTRLVHVWQDDIGFRLARVRNRAIAAAQGDYLIFLDGDMVIERHFVADHLAAARPRCFTQGQRTMAGATLSARMLATHLLDINPFVADLTQRNGAWRLPWLRATYRARDYGKKRVMGCNQGFWRDDLIAVNGFDERMAGWGREDTELAVRAYHAGVRRIQLYGTAVAVHLHHRQRGDGNASTPNDAYLAESERVQRTRCEHGVADHLADFSVAPMDLRNVAEQ